MTGKCSAVILLLLSCAVVGCTSVPRALYHKGRTLTHVIGRDIRQSDDEKWDVSVGRISVSTPLFRPVHEAKAIDKGPLDFEKKKTIPELYAALQKSGVDIANLQAHLREVQVAAALQGPLTTNTSSFESSTAASLAANIGVKSESTGAVDPSVNDVAVLEKILQNLLASEKFTATADGSGAFKSSIGESEKSTTVDSPPGVPQTLPSLITLPEAIAGKMAALLGSSEVDRVVPQADLASLAGSLSVHMTNMEQFYNPGMWVQDFREIGQEWKAYQVNFNVTVEPGWYTQLNQYDAVAEVEFGLRLKKGADLSGYTDTVKVVSVVPFEEAQAVTELDAALDSMSSALSLSAAFQAIGINGAYKDLRQITTRLDGLRTLNTMVVSYPDTNKVSIRMRAPAVPNRNGRDLQPRSRMFTATMLVRQTDQAEVATKAGAKYASEQLDHNGGDSAAVATQKFADGNGTRSAEPEAITPTFMANKETIETENQVFSGSIDSTVQILHGDTKDKVQVPALAICDVSLSTFWEPALVVGNWQEFPWREGSRYSKPFLKKRMKTHDCGKKQLSALVPPVRVEEKKFDIESVEGVYWSNGGRYEGVIKLAATVALNDARLTVVGHGLPAVSLGKGKVGVFHIPLDSPPVDAKKPYEVAVFLTDGPDKASQVKMVPLVPVGYEPSEPDKEITISIDKPGMKVDSLPLKELTPQQLETLVGKELRVLIGELADTTKR